MRPVFGVQEEVPQKQGCGLAEVPSVVVQARAERQMQKWELEEHELVEVDKALKRRVVPHMEQPGG